MEDPRAKEPQARHLYDYIRIGVCMYISWIYSSAINTIRVIMSICSGYGGMKQL